VAEALVKFEQSITADTTATTTTTHTEPATTRTANTLKEAHRRLLNDGEGKDIVVALKRSLKLACHL
jgi:hypothetical protein